MTSRNGLNGNVSAAKLALAISAQGIQQASKANMARSEKGRCILFFEILR
jgi:hypothetical protein